MSRTATLVVLGTGEAFDGTLPNTSLLLRAGGTKLLLDCGPLVPPRLWEEAPDPSALDGIWISHVHGDHLFGIPALLGRMWEEGRRKPLDVLGARGILSHVQHVFAEAYPGLLDRLRFPAREVAVEPGETIRWRGWTVRSAESEHGARNLAARVELPGGAALCYSGDGRPTSASAALAKKAYWIHECFAAREAPEGHADLDCLMREVEKNRPVRLGLVHLSRNHRREVRARAADLAAGGAPVDVPAPGERWELRAAEPLEPGGASGYAGHAMDVAQVIACLNAVHVGDLDAVRGKLRESREACARLGHDDLAERLEEARRALDGGDVRTFRKGVETVIARLGHLK